MIFRGFSDCRQRDVLRPQASVGASKKTGPSQGVDEPATTAGVDGGSLRHGHAIFFALGEWKFVLPQKAVAKGRIAKGLCAAGAQR